MKKFLFVIFISSVIGLMGCKSKLTSAQALENAIDDMIAYCDFISQKIENIKDKEKQYDFISCYLYISLSLLKITSFHCWRLSLLGISELGKMKEKIDMRVKLCERKMNDEEYREKFIETIGKEVRQNMDVLREGLLTLKSYSDQLSKISCGLSKNYATMHAFAGYLDDLLKTLNVWKGNFWEEREVKNLERKMEKDYKILVKKCGEILRSAGICKVVNLFNGVTVYKLKEEKIPISSGYGKKISLAEAIEISIDDMIAYCEFILRKIEDKEDKGKQYKMINNFMFISLEWLKDLSECCENILKSISAPEIEEIKEKMCNRRELSEKNKNEFFQRYYGKLTDEEFMEKCINIIGKDVKQNLNMIKEGLLIIKLHSKEIEKQFSEEAGYYTVAHRFIWYLNEILKSLEVWKGYYWEEEEVNNLIKRIRKHRENLENECQKILHLHDIKKVVKMPIGNITVFVMENGKTVQLLESRE